MPAIRKTPTNLSPTGVLNSRRLERARGLAKMETYSSFAESVQEVKRDFLQFLAQARKEHKSVAAYGAPAKGKHVLSLLRDWQRLHLFHRG